MEDRDHEQFARILAVQEDVREPGHERLPDVAIDRRMSRWIFGDTVEGLTNAGGEGDTQARPSSLVSVGGLVELGPSLRQQADREPH